MCSSDPLGQSAARALARMLEEKSGGRRRAAGVRSGGSRALASKSGGHTERRDARGQTARALGLRRTRLRWGGHQKAAEKLCILSLPLCLYLCDFRFYSSLNVFCFLLLSLSLSLSLSLYLYLSVSLLSLPCDSELST